MFSDRRLAWTVALTAWAAVRTLHIGTLGWGSGLDVNLFGLYARRWSGGAVPYADFAVEYPPGAMLVFGAVGAWAGDGDYARAFGGAMLAADLAAFMMLVHAGRRAGRPMAAAATYLAFTFALQPVLLRRFDIVPAAVVLASLLLLPRAGRVREAAAFSLLGLGGAIKLWPLVLAPLWLAVAARRRGRAGLVAGIACLALGLALPALPFAARAGPAMASVLEFHSRRGLQIESTWGSLVMALRAAGVMDASIVHEYGAYHVRGRWPDLLASWTLPVAAVLALAPQVTWARRARRDPPAMEALALAAVAAVLGLVVGGKVLSPQFLLWLAPIVPLALAGGWAVVAAVGAAVLSSAVYPHLYPYLTDDLVHPGPGHGVAVALMCTRNLLLVALYVAAVEAVRAGRAVLDFNAGRPADGA
ncbi:MAG TPA: glycosyltransferase 87 family protein [Vicinamibacteria bacterium]|nr:glycosyltransferase 87 family protein [Vicinamibacteria bacterium]